MHLECASLTCTKSKCAVVFEARVANASKTINRHKSANMSSTSTSSNRGGPCRFLWGKHYGKKAWFNKKGTDSKEKYVVITLETVGSYSTQSGFKHMIAKGHHGSAAVGESRVEKAFDQIPEIEQNTSSLFTKLAKCNVKPSEKLTAMLNERLAKANDRQERKGPKALWHRVQEKPAIKRDNNAMNDA
jgi:hypothetical protein